MKKNQQFREITEGMEGRKKGRNEGSVRGRKEGGRKYKDPRYETRGFKVQVKNCSLLHIHFK